MHICIAKSNQHLTYMLYLQKLPQRLAGLQLLHYSLFPTVLLLLGSLSWQWNTVSISEIFSFIVIFRTLSLFLRPPVINTRPIQNYSGWDSLTNKFIRLFKKKMIQWLSIIYFNWKLILFCVLKYASQFYDQAL